MDLFLIIENSRKITGEFNLMSGSFGLFHSSNASYATSWVNFGVTNELEFWKSECWLKEEWKQTCSGSLGETKRINFELELDEDYVFLACKSHCSNAAAGISTELYLYDVEFIN